MALLVAGGAPVGAQVFESGSTGEWGPLEPVADVAIALPEDGVIHATAVHVPPGVTVTFLRNAADTPVTVLATGDVIIEGTLDVSGQPGAPAPPGSGFEGLGGLAGPAGSDGGSGRAVGGTAGLGPGGGGGSSICNAGGGASATAAGARGGACTCASEGGPAMAEALWSLLHGGFGGGAGPTGAGGGGGGAITVAATGTITVDGIVRANGGDAWLQGGAGGGGSIRLVADLVTGVGLLQAAGGQAVSCLGGGPGGDGLVRLEAFELDGDLATFAYPAPHVLLPTPALPFDATERPTVRVVGISGQTVAAGPPAAGHPHLAAPLPLTAGLAYEVELEARGVPVGAVVTVAVAAPGVPRALFESTPLVGTMTLSMATATVVMPEGDGVAAVEAWIGSVPLP